MELSKNEWDFLLWPRTWHKRINSTILTLIPGCIFVGLFDMLGSSPSILKDYILTAESGVFQKSILAILMAVIIGFLDVFCFAWPIADLCKYLARRSEKFIVPGFHVILMKTYAFSHLLFIPSLLLTIPTGLKVENLSQETPFLEHLLVIVLLVYASMQLFWQLGILLRTISVKSKLELSGKLIAGGAIFIWFSLEGGAIGYLIRLAYELLGKLG